MNLRGSGAKGAILGIAILGIAIARAAPDPTQGDGRIVGGFRALEGSAPWQVEIYSTYVYAAADLDADAALADGDPKKLYLSAKAPWERDHRCGGVFIGGAWVLTAAHCVLNVTGDVLTARRVRVGTQDLSQGGTTYRIERAVVHKDYDDIKKQHDIALLKIAPDGATHRPVAGLRSIRILGRQPGDRPLTAFDRVAVTGWGLTGARDANGRALAVGGVLRASAALMQVDVTVFPPSQCEKVADYQGFMGSGVICAGSDTPAHDSCNGDSGGPLTRAQGPTERVLVGLVSWGKGCGVAGVPGIYTDVAQHADWIEGAKQAPAGRVSRR